MAASYNYFSISVSAIIFGIETGIYAMLKLPGNHYSCQYSDDKSFENGSRPNFGQVVCHKSNSDNGRWPIKFAVGL
jgi:hypothetical protein